MTDQYTPTTEEVRLDYVMTYTDKESSQLLAEQSFDRWLAARDAIIVSAAEQRGAVKALQHAQQLFAGFDHTVDEARDRLSDRVSMGHFIRVLDDEISDTKEGLAEYLESSE